MARTGSGRQRSLVSVECPSRRQSVLPRLLLAFRLIGRNRLGKSFQIGKCNFLGNAGLFALVVITFVQTVIEVRIRLELGYLDQSQNFSLFIGLLEQFLSI